MNDVAKMLLIVLAIDLFFMMGQVAMTELNPAADFYNAKGDLLKDYDAGDYTVFELDGNNLDGMLPSSADSVASAEDGNVFTDIVKSARNWFLESTGLSYIGKVVNAFPNFLKAINLPPVLSFGLGAIWHGFTLFLFVLLIWGRT